MGISIGETFVAVETALNKAEKNKLQAQYEFHKAKQDLRDTPLAWEDEAREGLKKAEARFMAYKNKYEQLKRLHKLLNTVGDAMVLPKTMESSLQVVGKIAKEEAIKAFYAEFKKRGEIIRKHKERKELEHANRFNHNDRVHNPIQGLEALEDIRLKR